MAAAEEGHFDVIFRLCDLNEVDMEDQDIVNFERKSREGRAEDIRWPYLEPSSQSFIPHLTFYSLQ